MEPFPGQRLENITQPVLSLVLCAFTWLCIYEQTGRPLCKRSSPASPQKLHELLHFLPQSPVNVNKIKDFGEAAKRELMMDRQTFEMARRLSHDTMEERVPWSAPRPLALVGSLVTTGANSTEKLTQRDREMGILQEIFLSKERCDVRTNFISSQYRHKLNKIVIYMHTCRTPISVSKFVCFYKSSTQPRYWYRCIPASLHRTTD